MTGRKAIAGLSLLCALAFCAFGAANASAKGTTAGECSSAAPTKDFEDAHCDKVKSGGSFGHILFPAGTATKVTAVNDLTGTKSSFILRLKFATILTEITCENVSVTGTITNIDTSGSMSLSFGIFVFTFSGCKVLAPASAVGKCTATIAKTETKVSDPMNIGLGEERELPQGGKIKVLQEGKGTEMALKLAAAIGTKLTTLTIAGAECPAALKGEKTIEGSLLAVGGRGGAEATTSSGATATFTAASTLGGFTFAGNPATLEGTLTFRKEGGNPLTITTTEK